MYSTFRDKIAPGQIVLSFVIWKKRWSLPCRHDDLNMFLRGQMGSTLPDFPAWMGLCSKGGGIVRFKNFKYQSIQYMYLL
jgi:hypothetical protein